MAKPKPAWGYEPTGRPLTPDKKKSLIRYFNDELQKKERPPLSEALEKDLLHAAGMLAGLTGNKDSIPGKGQVKAALESIHKAAFELSEMLDQLDWVSRGVLRKHLRIPEAIERHQERTTDLWAAARQALTAEFAPGQGQRLRRDENLFFGIFLKHLVDLYTQAFGAPPGQGFGPFFRIVSYCLTLAGTPPHSDDALEIRIRRAIS